MMTMITPTITSKRFDPTVKPKPNAGCNTASCGYDKGDCPQ